MAYDEIKAAKLADGAVWLAKQISRLKVEIEEMSEGDLTLGDIAEIYVLAKGCHEVVDDARKMLHKFGEHLSYNKLPDLFDHHGVKSFTTDEGYRVTVTTRISASMLDKQEGYKWLEDNGLGDLIQPTVNASSLSAALKSMMEDQNIEPPADVFKVTPASYTSITKVKR